MSTREERRWTRLAKKLDLAEGVWLNIPYANSEHERIYVLRARYRRGERSEVLARAILDIYGECDESRE